MTVTCRVPSRTHPGIVRSEQSLSCIPPHEFLQYVEKECGNRFRKTEKITECSSRNT
ncbi:hypothetical protein ASZ90_016949 [hydrocarbon metagenome]|uniref:Uncharacterized protein n=1 Tax=hydrocarbon metagenome TaxID=938273 RepID=A0A0W8EAY1_9ZZZZ